MLQQGAEAHLDIHLLQPQAQDMEGYQEFQGGNAGILARLSIYAKTYFLCHALKKWSLLFDFKGLRLYWFGIYEFQL